MSDGKVYAEDVNYWMTSQSSPTSWSEKAKAQIVEVGGTVTGEMQGMMRGQAGVMLLFELAGQEYKVMYPILESRGGNTLAATRQAWTALYHDVKSRAVSAKFVGARAAFHGYLLLPDGSGRTANQLTAPESAEKLPTVFLLPEGGSDK